MIRKSNKKLLSLILSIMLIVAMACNMTACSDNNKENPNAGTEAGDTGAENQQLAELGQTEDVQTENLQAENEQAENIQSEHAQTENAADLDTVVLGEGKTTFSFTVVAKDGTEKFYEIHTDQTIVGDALLELSLIAGDTAEYGLYVKTVDGITADYDTDGTYWAFYINGEYAMTGVDTTPITEGETYTFKVE